MSERERTLDYLALDEVTPAPRNPKQHMLDPLRASIGRFGFTAPALLDERTGALVVGHGRTEALAAMREDGESAPAGVRVDEAGRWLVPVVRGWSSRSDAEAAAYLLADNQLTIAGGWDEAELAAMLAELIDADPDLNDVLGFDPDELAALLGGDGGGDGDGAGEPGSAPSLAERFLLPPLDVFDARQGWWRERKKRWLSIGIRSELGREGGLVFGSGARIDPAFYQKKKATEKRLGRPLSTAEFRADHHVPGKLPGTSVFDPVLCELAYRWFCPPGGAVLDPFAGGCVRGVVAGLLGRPYLGNDLSAAQVEANREQVAAMVSRGLFGGRDDRPEPAWSVGDSTDWVSTLEPRSFDLIFTCPPYYDLERYSDDPADLSTMDYEAFDAAFEAILAGAAAALRPDRFAVIVTGDVRDKRGHLHDLRGATIAAAARSGLHYCTGAVLVTAAGSVQITAAKIFSGTRTLARTHQNVLIFCNGDRKAAAAACGEVEVHLPEGVGDEDDEDVQ